MTTGRTCVLCEYTWKHILVERYQLWISITRPIWFRNCSLFAGNIILSEKTIYYLIYYYTLWPKHHAIHICYIFQNHSIMTELILYTTTWPSHSKFNYFSIINCSDWANSSQDWIRLNNWYHFYLYPAVILLKSGKVANITGLNLRKSCSIHASHVLQRYNLTLKYFVNIVCYDTEYYLCFWKGTVIRLCTCREFNPHHCSLGRSAKRYWLFLAIGGNSKIIQNNTICLRSYQPTRNGFFPPVSQHALL